MILVIGGAGSGKLDYVKSLGYSEREIADGARFVKSLEYSKRDAADRLLDGRKVVYNLQNIVFDDPDRAPELLEALLLMEVVVCNEVGSGIVPLSARERQAREATGRLCIRLAARATRVVRLVCGIPTVIKG